MGGRRKRVLLYSREPSPGKVKAVSTSMSAWWGEGLGKKMELSDHLGERNDDESLQRKKGAGLTISSRRAGG